MKKHQHTSHPVLTVLESTVDPSIALPSSAAYAHFHQHSSEGLPKSKGPFLGVLRILSNPSSYPNMEVLCQKDYVHTGFWDLTSSYLGNWTLRVLELSKPLKRTPELRVTETRTTTTSSSCDCAGKPGLFVLKGSCPKLAKVLNQEKYPKL